MAITPEPRNTKSGPRWRVRYRIDGQQSSRTFTAEAGAEEFANLIELFGPAKAVEILEARTGTTETVTVKQLCETHIDQLAGVQADTKRKYAAMVRDLAHLAELPITAVTEANVNQWVAGLSNGGAAAKTVANKHGFLASVFKKAHTRGLVESNPCEGTRLPRTEVRGKTFLTHGEYKQFLEFFTPFWQPLVMFLFGTGLRFGEATALKIRDLDLPGKSVAVSRAWKRGNVLGPPKSRKSVRTVPLSPELVKTLAQLVKDRDPGEWLFTNQRGGPVRHPTFLENAWNPAVRLANGEPAQAGKRIGRRRDAQGEEIKPAKTPLGKRPTAHDARHTYASWLLAAGVPINVVQACLGHESITTTVDTYGHVMPHARDAVTGAISDALSGAQQGAGG